MFTVFVFVMCQDVLLLIVCRSNERLAEANTKLLSERQRSKSLITSSIVNGGLGGPALDVGAYGASLGPLNRSLGLGTPLLGTGTVGESQSSRVEAYLAKVSDGAWSPFTLI